MLGLLARRFPHHLQGRALTYGLVGAFIFRLIAVAMAAWLLHWRIVKLLGGLYLIWVSVKHFLFHRTPAPTDDAHKHHLIDGVDFEHAKNTHARAFWIAVASIELTDIAFAVDSIVAAIGVVGPGEPGKRHPKLWVVLIGGMLGVMLMRFAAVMFIKLLEKFPRFETAAYLLVVVIGAKLVADWAINSQTEPNRLNMHDPDSFAFWVFWLLMLISFLIGFIPKRGSSTLPTPPPPGAR